MMLACSLAVACVTLFVAPALAAAQQTRHAARHPAPPTLILTGGKVFTADSTRPWAEALAIRGDRIVAVGRTADVRHLAGPATREIALGGRVVIPGINDAHDHLAVLSQDVFAVPPQALPGTTSVLTIVGGRVVYDQLPRKSSAASRER